VQKHQQGHQLPNRRYNRAILCKKLYKVIQYKTIKFARNRTNLFTNYFMDVVNALFGQNKKYKLSAIAVEWFSSVCETNTTSRCILESFSRTVKRNRPFSLYIVDI